METVSTAFGKATLTLETGKLAKQANGSILVRYGDTVVLVAATADKGSGVGADFFPLSVHYVEKAYAAGRIPGGFFKREGRLSESETLTSRLIDRPLRPSFDENYLAETMIMATVLSSDQDNAPDIAAMIGASAALCVSDIPFYQPIGGIRVGRINGEFVVNPTPAELEESELNIIMAASKDAILMVEGEAKEVSEEVMLDALWFGQEQVQPIIRIQEELMQRCGKPKREVAIPEIDEELHTKVTAASQPKLVEALQITEKQERYQRLDAVVDEVLAEVFPEGSEPSNDDIGQAKSSISSVKKKVMRERILKDQIRIDGRGPKDIRQIDCEARILPRAHGSALFTRGETQALGVVTLGTKEDEQLIDSLHGVSYRNFMLHYNFPSFCVGEARPPRGPGRREIGHGHLAERGLSHLLPTREEFPYTIRLVSEVLESNGSSSMATVCSGSLAMMDAGIPLKAAAAGIAMGLIYDDGQTSILSDILGDEDHLGDMDFKVVGTTTGITALQMDIKIKGLTREIVKASLEQACEGRLHILKIMGDTLEQSRAGLSSYAPRFITHKIPPDKISIVIGPGGKMIKSIVERTGVKINISDDGLVSIASGDHKAVDAALEIVRDLTRTVEIGTVYDGLVKRVVDFGAFVEVFPGTEGLVHISNLAEGRVRAVTDVVREGDTVKVKAMGLDKRGKLQLSIKDV
ncbi:MAG TPA: polyribonucleotide nucleotidyltransferase [Deltaproteobacteria bacterium]|jgi:polyribonucleotide nucleotidyltransferase|nr:MAG: polyribonucleotide nucleotidyltransferase [Pseudomonadota bacterium]HBM51988.1 polyribonucleotide nucleotidyltransferase [Deltaproteobacteria bacterium]|tara:strand:+ start:9509 stop:11587 length:2079 start_codon:yes stop_codon:yes gene_type:complete